jgi:hypothetical protein
MANEEKIEKTSIFEKLGLVEKVKDVEKPLREKEQIIENYFNTWLTKDGSGLKKIFYSNVTYSECYGPEYHGLEDIERWFKDWNEKGTVLVWDIKQFIHHGNMTVTEWYFKYEYNGNIEEFEGVSLIEFNCENRIVSLKEFLSKIPHYNPYSKLTEKVVNHEYYSQQ